MIETLLSPTHRPFAIAIGLLIGLLLIEVAGSLTGHRLGDHDADHGDLHEGDAEAGGLLDWIGLGKVPLVILLAEFCAAFASFGLLLQSLAGALARPLPGWAAALAVLVPAVFATRWLSIGIARILPREETAAPFSSSSAWCLRGCTGGLRRKWHSCAPALAAPRSCSTAAPWFCRCSMKSPASI